MVQTIREDIGIEDKHFLTLKSDVPESISGADIEWWITEYKNDQRYKIITLSIQAKKLYTNSYDQLGHKVDEGEKVYQID